MDFLFHQSSKCLMKNELRYVPLIGWSFLLLEMVFVKRDFVKDKPNLIKGFQKYGSYPLNSVVSGHLVLCDQEFLYIVHPVVQHY